MQSFIMNLHEVFIHIHQGCFAGTGAIVRLPQCQWSKPDGYGKISQCTTTTKHNKAKTVCIFLGIYCIFNRTLDNKFVWNYNRQKRFSSRKPISKYCLQDGGHSDIWYCYKELTTGGLKPSLTHWGRDKMGAISQTKFSHAFSGTRFYQFRLRFHWC